MEHTFRSWADQSSNTFFYFSLLLRLCLHSIFFTPRPHRARKQHATQTKWTSPPLFASGAASACCMKNLATFVSISCTASRKRNEGLGRAVATGGVMESCRCCHSRGGKPSPPPHQPGPAWPNSEYAQPLVSVCLVIVTSVPLFVSSFSWQTLRDGEILKPTTTMAFEGWGCSFSWLFTPPHPRNLSVWARVLFSNWCFVTGHFIFPTIRGCWGLFMSALLNILFSKPRQLQHQWIVFIWQ